MDFGRKTAIVVCLVAILCSTTWVQVVKAGEKGGHDSMAAAAMLALLAGQDHHEQVNYLPIPVPVYVKHGGGGHHKQEIIVKKIEVPQFYPVFVPEPVKVPIHHIHEEKHTHGGKVMMHEHKW